VFEGGEGSRTVSIEMLVVAVVEAENVPVGAGPRRAAG